jgi:Bacterial Ig domain
VRAKRAVASRSPLSRASWSWLGLLVVSACGTSGSSDLAGVGGRDGGLVSAEGPPRFPTARSLYRRAHAHFPGDSTGLSLRPAGGEDAGEDAGSESFWWIGADSTDPSAIPNSGVRASIDSVDYAPPGGCFSCWTSNMLENLYWGQIGFSACDPAVGPVFTAFYQIWNTAGPTPDGILLVDGETTAVTAGNHEFAMNVESGTVWSYAIDGVVFGSYDMGSDTASSWYGVHTWCEEGDGVAAPFVPPQVAMPSAMEVLRSGTWAPAAAAVVYNSAGISGVIGHLQDPQLPDEAIVVGGDAGHFAPGTPLWESADGGEAPEAGTTPDPPAYVIISSPAAAATVNGSVAIEATVTSTSTLDNVMFFVQSAATNYEATPCTLTAGPYDCPWDTTAVDDGQYYLTVQADDVHGVLTWADIEVTVDNSGAEDGGAEGGAREAGADAGGLDGGDRLDGGAGPESGDGSDSSTADDAGSDAAKEAGTPPSDDAGGASSGAAGNGGGCSCALAARPSRESAWGFEWGLVVVVASALARKGGKRSTSARRRHLGHRSR